MEMVPRSTRAQKMDALSSQANLAGYVTVIQAAFHCPKIFPMMMTPRVQSLRAEYLLSAQGCWLAGDSNRKEIGSSSRGF